jgi:hypothetical protein
MIRLAQPRSKMANPAAVVVAVVVVVAVAAAGVAVAEPRMLAEATASQCRVNPRVVVVAEIAVVEVVEEEAGAMIVPASRCHRCRCRHDSPRRRPAWVRLPRRSRR